MPWIRGAHRLPEVRRAAIEERERDLVLRRPFITAAAAAIGLEGLFAERDRQEAEEQAAKKARRASSRDFGAGKVGSST